MASRKLSIGLTMFLLAVMAASARAEDKSKDRSHLALDCRFVSIDNGKIVVSSKDGAFKTTFDLATDVKVEIAQRANGEERPGGLSPGKLEDLKPGKRITLKRIIDGKVTLIRVWFKTLQ